MREGTHLALLLHDYPNVIVFRVTTEFYSEFGEMEALGVGTLEPEFSPPLAGVYSPIADWGSVGKKITKEVSWKINQ